MTAPRQVASKRLSWRETELEILREMYEYEREMSRVMVEPVPVFFPMPDPEMARDMEEAGWIYFDEDTEMGSLTPEGYMIGSGARNMKQFKERLLR